MTKIPRYLSDPIQILWLQPDDIFIAVITYVIGINVIGFSLELIILMVSVLWGYSSVKKKYPRGFLKHMLYFLGYAKLKGYPIFNIKEFRE